MNLPYPSRRPDSVQSMDQVTVLNDFYTMLKGHASVLPSKSSRMIHLFAHLSPFRFPKIAEKYDKLVEFHILLKKKFESKMLVSGTDMIKTKY